MKKLTLFICIILLLVSSSSCDKPTQSEDKIEKAQATAKTETKEVPKQEKEMDAESNEKYD